MREKYTRAIKHMITAAVVVLFIWYCVKKRNELSILFEISPAYLIPMFLMMTIRRAMAANRFRTICKPLGANVSFLDAFFVNSASTLMNLVAPVRPGLAFRAVYLKKTHGVHYSYMPSLAVANAVIGLCVGGLLLLAANVAGLFFQVRTIWQLWALSALLLGTMAVFLVPLPDKLLNRKGKLWRRLRLMSDGWNRMRLDRKALLITCLYHVFAFLATSVLVYLALASLGLSLGFVGVIGMAVVNTLVHVVSFMPANLGVKEWCVGYVAALAGMDFDTGVAVALVMRLISVTLNLVTGAIGYFLLFRGTTISATEDVQTEILMDIDD